MVGRALQRDRRGRGRARGVAAAPRARRPRSAASDAPHAARCVAACERATRIQRRGVLRDARRARDPVHRDGPAHAARLGGDRAGRRQHARADRRTGRAGCRRGRADTASPICRSDRCSRHAGAARELGASRRPADDGVPRRARVRDGAAVLGVALDSAIRSCSASCRFSSRSAAAFSSSLPVSSSGSTTQCVARRARPDARSS